MSDRKADRIKWETHGATLFGNLPGGATVSLCGNELEIANDCRVVTFYETTVAAALWPHVRHYSRTGAVPHLDPWLVTISRADAALLWPLIRQFAETGTIGPTCKDGLQVGPATGTEGVTL